MPKVSVVMPVCNVEKYLGECLDSILGQTLKDIEVICVDDGSTDGSAKILAECAARDARVKVLRQDRSGAGAARNKGLAETTGEYLFFCDADDWAGKDMLSSMYGKASETGADIVASGVCYYDDVTRSDYRRVTLSREVQSLPQPFSPADLGERLFSSLRMQAWNKLFRRQFVIDEGVSFQNQPRVNDVAFVAVALAAARRVAVDGGAYYHYRKNHGGSLCAGIDAMPDMACRAWLHVKAELERRGMLAPSRRAFALAASQALVNSLLAITDAKAAVAFFRQAKESLIPALGLARADVSDDAGEFFELDDPLQMFICRLSSEKAAHMKTRAALLAAKSNQRCLPCRLVRKLFGRLEPGRGGAHG